jgi:hypothetical protein
MQQLLELVRQAQESGDYQPLVDLIPYARVSTQNRNVPF